MVASATAPLLESLPGAEIALPGIADLRAGRGSTAAAAVLVASRRLRAAGLDVPAAAVGVGSDQARGEPGHHLFALLAADPDVLDPHSRYNAVLRRIGAFAAALERAAPR